MVQIVRDGTSRKPTAIAQLVERRISDQKVADPRFDSRTGNAP